MGPRITVHLSPFAFALGSLLVACGGGSATRGPGGPGTAGSTRGDGGDAGSNAGSGGAAGNVGPGGAGRGSGPLGQGGGGAVGGRADAGGSGGATCSGPIEPPTSCPGSLCGNDVIDSTEACDGDDLAGQTCQSWGGFPSGRLRCTADCTVDASDCSECTDDPSVVRCGVTALPGNPGTIAMAATATEVAMAGIAYIDRNRTDLSLTRFSPKLDVLGSVRISDPALDAGDTNDFAYHTWNLVLAPLPSGWIVAAFSGSELFLHAVAADGEDLGRQTVAKLPWSYQSFIPRPDGGPLLVWATGDQDHYLSSVRLHAAVVSADGLSMTTPVALPLGGSVLNGLGRGAYVGGAFYVPITVDEYGYPELRIVRLSGGGAVVSVADPLPATYVSTPTLVAGDGALRAVFYTQGADSHAGSSEVVWQRFDLAGASTSPPIFFGSSIGVGAAVALGDTTAQLFQRDYASTLELVRMTGDGEVVEARSVIAQATNLGFSWLDVVSRGSEVVVAWKSAYGDRLMMARVAR